MPHVRYAVADAIAEITLDRAPVNALSLALLDEILAAYKRAAADDGVRAVVLASAIPKYFCAGLDLDILMGTARSGDGGLGVRRLLDKLYIELADVQYNLGKPSIAAVTGAARGGGSTLSIQSNVVVAGESATFGYPEIDVGLLPAIHLAHLPGIIGRHRAFELLFSGRAFSAHEAATLGLVSRVVPDAELLDAARTLARTFAAKSPVVMRLGHQAFMRFNDYRRDIAAAADAFCVVAASDDAQEGLAAFVEKRTPKWS